MKKIVMTFLALVMVFTLTACSIESSFKINKQGDMTGTIAETITVDDMRTVMLMGCETEEESKTISETPDERIYEVMKEQFTAGIDATVKVSDMQVDGKPALKLTATLNTNADTELKDAGYTYDATKFIFSSPEGIVATGAVANESVADAQADLSNELASMIITSIKVTMPKKVVYTNGKLSSNGKTVTWDTKSNPDDVTIFAYTTDAAELVKLSNVTKNITYKSSTKVTALSKIKAIYVNGEEIKSKSKVTFASDGEYTIKVKTKDYTKTMTVIKKTKK